MTYTESVRKNLRISAKPGDLIRISWLDASFYLNAEDIDPTDIARGGVLLKTTGYLVQQCSKSVVIVGEQDEDDRPQRDFNLIPRCLIQSIKLIQRKKS